MPRFKSADVKDRAAAGMEAFGKNPKKMKGPVGSKAPPFGKKLPLEPDADDGAKPGTFRPHKEPDADDMKKVGKGQAKGKKKGKY